MRCNGFKRENLFGQTDMQRVPGLQFYRHNVLGRHAAAAAATTKVHSDDDTVFLRQDSVLE